MTQDWMRLRTTFDTAAALYDDARPGYPDTLFDDLLRLTAIPAGGCILEIGGGTGKATLPLAQRGYRLLCLEPGSNLAAVARDNLAGYPLVEVSSSTFEDWPLEPEAFDLVIAATSFDWVNPAIRSRKAAAALQPGGCLAVFWNAHVELPGEDRFFEVVQEIYGRHTPEMVGRPHDPHDLPTTLTPDLLTNGLFEEVAVKHYPWTETYDTDRYLNLLQTFSGHIALPEAARHRLLADIGRLIDQDFDGRVVKHHVAVLLIARRV